MEKSKFAFLIFLDIVVIYNWPFLQLEEMQRNQLCAITYIIIFPS